MANQESIWARKFILLICRMSHLFVSDPWLPFPFGRIKRNNGLTRIYVFYVYTCMLRIYTRI